jgi:hypothetical protein
MQQQNLVIGLAENLTKLTFQDLTFDPFQPLPLQKAFKETPTQDRPVLLSVAMEPMADGLRGISSVVRLVDDDAASFEAGLKLALQRNPSNLTAARALIWYYIRIGSYREAEVQYNNIELHWPQYNEIAVEHQRLLVLQQSAPIEYFLTKQRFFKSPASHASYALQVGLPELESHKAKLLQLGKLAFADMLRLPAIGETPVLGANETKALWEAIAIIGVARTVAIVGNGPRLRGSKLGENIDRHDAVIRCNFAEIDNFVEDVGSKTSVIMFNESLRHRIPKLRARSVQYKNVPALGLHPEPSFGLSNEEFLSFPRIATLPPSVRRFLSDICYSRSTTGLMAINLLQFVFQKQISIYGFDFFDNVSNQHYYDNQLGAYLGHELQYERWFVQEFAAKNFANAAKYF